MMVKHWFILFFWMSFFPCAMMAQSFIDVNGKDNYEQIQMETVEKPVVSVIENQLYVANVQENTVVEVKNMLGENVRTFRMKSKVERFDLNLKKGFYIVRIENFLHRIVVK